MWSFMMCRTFADLLLCTQVYFHTHNETMNSISMKIILQIIQSTITNKTCVILCKRTCVSPPILHQHHTRMIKNFYFLNLSHTLGQHLSDMLQKTICPEDTNGCQWHSSTNKTWCSLVVSSWLFCDIEKMIETRYFGIKIIAYFSFRIAHFKMCTECNHTVYGIYQTVLPLGAKEMLCDGPLLKLTHDEYIRSQTQVIYGERD